MGRRGQEVRQDPIMVCHVLCDAEHSLSPQWRADRSRRRSRPAAARYLARQLGVMGPHFGCGAGECGACHVIVGDHAILLATRPYGRPPTRTSRRWRVWETPRDRIAAARLYCRASDCNAAIVCRAPDECGGAVETESVAYQTDVKEALDRNLCRCGSHNRIVRAVLRAATERPQDGSTLADTRCRPAWRRTRDCRPG